ncbi:sirohydrochlorin chelatase [Paenibacillus hodogayensis]|uniref:Sirohydrochlorin chelatase n=1 Tax=Paenibacillus hodogayensis TaxID=279208 RepID=A0ABV5W761_9BACL
MTERVSVMGQAGVLVISHGSRSAEWIERIDRAVAEIRLPATEQGPVPIVSSFLELAEGRLIQDGIDALEALGVTEMIVIPLFISYGSTHVDEIRYALGDLPHPSSDTDLEPFRLRASVSVCPPLDDDPVVANILLEHLRDITHRPERQRVLLIGHGSELPDFYARWKRGLGRIADRLQQLGGYAGVHTALLLPDESREALGRFIEENPHEDVLVAPVFLSTGYFTSTVIPQRLGGLRHRYTGKALLPHPAVSRWMERQITAMLGAIQSHKQ